MAGNFPGNEPNSAPQSDLQGRPLIHVPTSSRSRTVHGAWSLGAIVGAVYSSRREAAGRCVIFTLSDGALQLTGYMPPSTARAMAAALVAGADHLDTRGAAA